MSLTQQQRDRFSLQFLMLDKNSDGKISTPQLGRLLRCWGFCPTEAEVQAAAKVLDPENVGFITKEKALDAAAAMLQQITTELEVKEALRVLDTDGDGFLTTAELRHILMNLGVRLTTEEVDEVIADAEVDEAHHISTEEFARMLFADTGDNELDALE